MFFFRQRRRVVILILGAFFLVVGAFILGAQPKRTIEDFPSPVTGAPMLKLQPQTGTDYAQAEGAVIRANIQGKVIYAGSDPILGQRVEIDCSEGWRVVYGGLKNLRVKSGDCVDRKQAIGQIDQNHLHYEVWQGNKLQNNWK